MKTFLKLLTGKNTKGKNEAENFYSELSAEVLARTLWGEARGEGAEGMEAVAHIIMNRVSISEKRGGYWWGNDVISVCQKPYQFSCWNRSDPNYRKLQDVTDKDIHFATALRIARRVLAKTSADITGGATHYHERSIMPYWAKGEVPTRTIGRHIFYKLVEA